MKNRILEWWRKREGSSLSYGRYFQGFIGQRTIGQDGRVRTVRVYEGKYYLPENGRLGHIGRRVLYTALLLLAAGTFLFGAVRPIESNMVKHIAGVQGLTLAGFIWALIGVVNYWMAGKILTVGEKNNVSRSVKRSSLFTGIAAALTALLTLLFALSHGQDRGQTLLCALLYLVSAALLGVLYHLERTLLYREADAEELEE